MRRLVALIAALAVAGCGSSHAGSAGDPSSSLSGQLPPGLEGHPAPRMNLVDARGGRLDTATLQGKPYLVTFLYTRCRDVCPLIGDEVRQALRDLGPAARRVAVVGVSVDPAGDRAGSVRHWLALHREPANFHYLIGTRAQLEPVWRAWFTQPQSASSESTHTAAIWFVDARNRLVSDVPAGAPIRSAAIARSLRNLL